MAASRWLHAPEVDRRSVGPEERHGSQCRWIGVPTACDQERAVNCESGATARLGGVLQASPDLHKVQEDEQAPESSSSQERQRDAEVHDELFCGVLVLQELLQLMLQGLQPRGAREETGRVRVALPVLHDEPGHLRADVRRCRWQAAATSDR